MCREGNSNVPEEKTKKLLVNFHKNNGKNYYKGEKTMKPTRTSSTLVVALTMALLGATSAITFAADATDPVDTTYQSDTGTFYTTTDSDVGSSAPGSPTVDTMDKPKNYVVLKGGAYVPSDKFDLTNITPGSIGERDNFDRDPGFSAELAVGRYLLPFLAVEIGSGYFQSKAFSNTASSAMLRVIPIIATGKLILPLGIFEPYGLFGIGGYISDLDRKGDGRDAFRDPEVTFGLHAGAGFNVNFTPRTFMGLEGKYLWAEPSFGGDDVKLDGFITTAHLGFRF